jgi:Fe-S-cluster containining protein
MSRLDGKQCPFYKKECLQSMCAIYDERLDNCALHLVVYNLYKLDRTLVEGMPTDQTGPKRFPFQPKN